MKVRVKTGQKGFIYGSLRTEGKEFTLKPVEHSTETDSEGEPLIISPETQFSKVWMEEVNPKKPDSDEPKEPSDMKVKQLKEALIDAGLEIPEGALKAELVDLLEDHLTS